MSKKNVVNINTFALPVITKEIHVDLIPFSQRSFSKNKKHMTNRD
jgi:hypothetical protein